MRTEDTFERSGSARAYDPSGDLRAVAVLQSQSACEREWP
jgi:hypothetical protein